MIQISVYNNSGDMPRIVSDLRLGEAPASILKAKATLALNKATQSRVIASTWRRLERTYHREWTREAGDFQVIIHVLSDN